MLKATLTSYNLEAMYSHQETTSRFGAHGSESYPILVPSCSYPKFVGGGAQ